MFLWKKGVFSFKYLVLCNQNSLPHLEYSKKVIVLHGNSVLLIIVYTFTSHKTAFVNIV